MAEESRNHECLTPQKVNYKLALLNRFHAQFRDGNFDGGTAFAFQLDVWAPDRAGLKLT